MSELADPAAPTATAPLRWARIVGTALPIGILLGTFCAVGDSSAVTVINGLANAAGPWIVAAFLAGILQRGNWAGAIAGGLTLVTAVTAYYGAIVVGGHGFPLPVMVVWLPMAAASGGLFGMAGGRCAMAGVGRRTASAVLVSGALLAEAAFRLIQLQAWTGVAWDHPSAQVVLVDVLAAVAVLLILVERGRWLRALALLPVVVGAGLLLLLAAEGLFQRVTALVIANA